MNNSPENKLDTKKTGVFDFNLIKNTQNLFGNLNMNFNKMLELLPFNGKKQQCKRLYKNLDNLESQCDELKKQCQIIKSKINEKECERHAQSKTNNEVTKSITNDNKSLAIKDEINEQQEELKIESPELASVESPPETVSVESPPETVSVESPPETVSVESPPETANDETNNMQGGKKHSKKLKKTKKTKKTKKNKKFNKKRKTHKVKKINNKLKKKSTKKKSKKKKLRKN